MQEVECLNDLIRILGKDKVELLFTEYIMYLVAKADKLASRVYLMDVNKKIIIRKRGTTSGKFIYLPGFRSI